MEGLLDRIVGGGAGIDDHADLVVEATDAFEKLRPAKIGQAKIDDRNAERRCPKCSRASVAEPQPTTWNPSSLRIRHRSSSSA